MAGTPLKRWRQVEQALQAGKTVVIVYVHRDPVEALVNGALPRAMRMGRTVPLAEHAKTHEGAARTVIQLAERYANHERVEVRVVDNTRGKGNAVESDLSLPDGTEYTQLREKLRQALEAERAAGRISDAVYRGTVHSEVQGGIEGVRGPGGEGDGSGPQPVSRQEVAGATADSAARVAIPAAAADAGLVAAAARVDPALEIELPDGTRTTAAEALRTAQEQAAAEVADAQLLQVAAACAI